MDDESTKIVAFFLSYVLGGLALGVMAARKNRSYWAWALIGGLFCFPCIIAMVFLPPLCPNCHRPLTQAEWKGRVCPTCGKSSAVQPSEEEGYTLLARATKLEIEGQVRQAIVAYRKVTENHPGTAAANDAEKSLESLLRQIG
jgi:hypothetical protein